MCLGFRFLVLRVYKYLDVIAEVNTVWSEIYQNTFHVNHTLFSLKTICCYNMERLSTLLGMFTVPSMEYILALHGMTTIPGMK